ncbi:MAG: TIGR02206 family membrane protein [Gammaproteobacteria bacterium]|nr:MAG: TIGR02206 family membrane protein [Gammaproteobacteria bacterium]
MTSDPTFVLFGQAHLVTLALTLILGLLIARSPERPDSGGLARTMAWSLLILAVTKPILYVGVYDQPLAQSIPLDLCRINEFFCAYLLLARSYRMFEIAYFLAIAGSTSALLMPDLLHGFPDPRFLSFFLSHGLSVLAVLYAVFGFGFRPTLGSVGRIILFLGLYTAAIALINLLLDSNYLFLCRKPEGASILDYLGPWPVYVLGLFTLAVVACFLCYLPFAFRRK